VHTHAYSLSATAWNNSGLSPYYMAQCDLVQFLRSSFFALARDKVLNR